MVLSNRRLQEFVTAEINYFAGMCPKPVDLPQIFQCQTAAQAATLIHKVLPMHFATRIRQIEEIPHWDAVAELQQVHKTLTKSFHNLRILDQSEDLEPLNEVINDLRDRHKVILPLLSNAMAHLRSEMLVNEQFVDQWLDDFLMARIGTDLLTLHYNMLSSTDATDSQTGIVDSRCDPGQVCLQAVESVGQDTRFKGVAMHVESHVCGSSEKGIAFQFIPQYLKLLVTELLKNSATATLRTVPPGKPIEKSGEAGTVKVCVGADDTQVMIQVSDKGGGIPHQNLDSIYSYSWSTDNDMDTSDEQMPASWTDPLEGLGIMGVKTRLGMGLPLTRLYTQYFGGELTLKSIPGVGTDAFINLKRIDRATLPGRAHANEKPGFDRLL